MAWAINVETSNRRTTGKCGEENKRHLTFGTIPAVAGGTWETVQSEEAVSRPSFEHRHFESEATSPVAT